MGTSTPDQAECGCCSGIARPAPMPIDNRPGLPGLAYRVGTHGTFLATMETLLSRQPVLTSLTSRDDNDPTIALIDAWAVVLDVLSFYQERIANEGYLRTAREKRSVYELAHEIGYVPDPGRAAATYLAFVLETATGAPAIARIPAGTKVQSVPGPDQTPQTFETAQDLMARPRWNAMVPQRAVAWTPARGDTELWLAAAATALRVGDPILIVGDERRTAPASQKWDVRFLSAVEPSADGTMTRIAWARGLGAAPPHVSYPASENPRVYALRQRAALFGGNAPDVRTMPKDIAGRFHVDGDEWPNLSISKIASTSDPPNTIYLDAVYPKVTTSSWVVLKSPAHTELFLPDATRGDQAVANSSRKDFTLSSKTTRITFGKGENPAHFNTAVRETVVLTQSEELAVTAIPVREPVQGATVALDGLVDGLQTGMIVLVTGLRARVQVADNTTVELVKGDGTTEVLQPRTQLSVMAPWVDNPGRSRTWTVRTDDGESGTIIRPAGDHAIVPIPALPADDLLAEAATLGDLSNQPDPLRTTITFGQALTAAYDRSTCRICANVAEATHGETKREVLGSGDASRGFQTFALKQSPLTYVPSSGPTGSASTLRLNVADVGWEQKPSLYGLGPRDRAYVVRIADDRAVSIEFGDGSTGARLPTGRENVTATYRVGTGIAGNVPPAKLTLLATRPLGVAGVSNPLPAAGGADPEGIEDARGNAPRGVLTFDRVVSLSDYEDFTRSFAGIAKAQAAWLWDGETRLVFVTAAGIDGAAVDDITMGGLRTALDNAGDPHRAFRVSSYKALEFVITAGVWLRPGHDWAVVRSAVVAAIRDAFSFARRDLGQPVAASEVIVTIQQVQGVLAADVDDLRLVDGSPPVDGFLQALPARWVGSTIEPAQLLTIGADAGAITLSERT